MSTVALPVLTAGGIELDTSPDRFGFLRDSTDLIEDPDALRAQMDRDGYLYLPGFLDRAKVQEARHAICELLADEELLDSDYPVDQAIPRPDAAMDFRPDITNHHNAGKLIREVVYGDDVMRFFTRFLGGESTHFDFTWFRTITPGIGSYPHCDVIFMGRGTKNLYTAWVPFGDVPIEVGGLLLIEGSHKDQQIRDGYAALDIDTACQNRNNVSEVAAAGYPGYGAISLDMKATRDKVGGRLLTAEEYKMGDLLIFSVYTVHGSLDNHGREIRLSSDSRYQLASDPIDERWVGENPPGHGGKSIKGMIC